jgi:hypothetical protein
MPRSNDPFFVRNAENRFKMREIAKVYGFSASEIKNFRQNELDFWFDGLRKK